MTFRLTAVGFVVLAALTAYAVLSSGDAVGLADWLRRHGHPVYAGWLLWVVLAPVVLAGAGLAVRHSPWPWVVAVTLQLSSLAAAQARLGHLVDRWSWAVVVAALVLGLASIVSVLGRRSGPAPRPLQPS